MSSKSSACAAVPLANAASGGEGPRVQGSEGPRVRAFEGPSVRRTICATGSTDPAKFLPEVGKTNYQGVIGPIARAEGLPLHAAAAERLLERA